MKQIQMTAPAGARNNSLLSADNPAFDRSAIMGVLRQIAGEIGLRPNVLATLDALLSCLPPRRRRHVVFASNATLTQRMNGACERTLRRHIAILAGAGLLARIDSANRKRFVRRADDQAVAFGLDLSPLFDRLEELLHLAREAAARAARLALLRAAIRAALNRALQAEPDCPALAAIPALLRRKLPIETLESLLDQLEARHLISAAEPVLSATDGQSVRHHQKSDKEDIDRADEQTISLNELLTACPEPLAFAENGVRDFAGVMQLSERLAPMMGIEASLYHRAQSHIGPLPAALAIWIILGMGDRVRAMAGYFHALTLGPRANGFNAAAVLRRMARARSPMRVACHTPSPLQGSRLEEPA